MVELVDTQDLESCEETRTGSIPAIRTILYWAVLNRLFNRTKMSGFNMALKMVAGSVKIGKKWGKKSYKNSQNIK